MINVNSMDENERRNYIFGDQIGPITNRFGWLRGALLGDIHTFVDIVQSGQSSAGGGNLSIPILVCTGLELASSLYVGMTDYLDHSRYDATANVAEFISEFFTGRIRSIPRLFWDGVRNGIDHLFNPKSISYSQYNIQFSFYVAGNLQIIKTNNLIVIQVNSVELYNILEQAIDQYEIRLRNDSDLQHNFITAWDSIESHIRPIKTGDIQKTTEAQYLLGELSQTNPARLF